LRGTHHRPFSLPNKTSLVCAVCSEGAPGLPS
jgi:hypothetical protein